MLSIDLNSSSHGRNGPVNMRNYAARTTLFLALLTLGLALFGISVIDLVKHDTDYYSHIPVLYLVFGVILFWERKKIFINTCYSPVFGSLAVIAGIAVFVFSRMNQAAFSPNNYFSALSLSMLIFTAGIFFLCFGPAAFKKAAFPIFLLVLAIPLPDFMLTRFTYILRIYSTSSTVWILEMFGIYPIRDGFFLTLPEVTLEVAEQCSGIRSSIALLIISVLYGRYYLKTLTGRVLLVGMALVALPLKNGLRISALTILSIHWDKKVLSGPMHTSGGMLFFGVALVWVMAVLFFLAGMERIALKKIKPAPISSEEERLSS